MLKIILASGSPRRRELLGQIGLAFEVIASNAEEKSGAADPGSLVEELSCLKAEAALDMLEDGGEDVLVIGADTVVASGNQVLGKPSGPEAAFQMLKRLSGKTHEVYTGVTLLYKRGGNGDGIPLVQRKVFHEVTKVSFYPMTEGEIRHYIETGDCMDKAGAYGIQGIFARYVRGIEGDYNNVVGLPAGRLYQEAKEWLGNEEGSDI